ncbi:hypothetical protein JYB55_21885 [Mycolicibacterium septicum]|nr:hypothetical protein [Mycolicibacterium septicum]
MAGKSTPPVPVDHNKLACDGAAMPANPGANQAVTITALAEYAMAQIPARSGSEPNSYNEAKS